MGRKKRIPYVEMRFLISNMFPIVCCLVALVMKSFGELLIIQEPDINSSNSVVYTCIAEDDRTALVWNRDLNVSPPASTLVQSRSSSGCALVKQGKCTTYWKPSNYWTVVNSTDYPLGPVFDSRWEDFEEIVFPQTGDSFKYLMNMRSSGTVVFSVRGYDIVTIQFHRIYKWPKYLHLKYFDTPYYINDCVLEEFISNEWNRKPCTWLRTPMPKESFIDKYKWNTLILQWNKNQMRICSELECVFELLFNRNSFEGYDMYIHINPVGLVRFHFYEYFRTTYKNVTLVSNEFSHDRKYLCIESTVNLCAGCALQVSVTDHREETQLIGNIFPNPTLKLLSAWEVVKLNVTLRAASRKYWKLKIVTVLNNTTSQGQWAINDFRECKPLGAKRNLKFRIYPTEPDQYESYNYCQNMLATRSIIATSHSDLLSHPVSESTRKYFDKNSYIEVTCPPYWANRMNICDPSGCACIQKTDVNTDVEGFPKLNDSDVEIILQKNGIVTFRLKFSKRFSYKTTYKITVNLQHTRLQNHPMNTSHEFSLQCSSQCNHTLNLFASTEYLMTVYTNAKYSQNRIYSTKFKTPASLGFEKDENLKVNVSGIFLQLKLPTIVNETLNSTVTVIVKGSSTCANRKLSEKLRKCVNMTKAEEGWIARSYSTHNFRPAEIEMIGYHLVANDTSDDCPLQPGKTYMILVVVVDEETGASAFIDSPPIHISDVKTGEKDSDDEKSIFGWIIGIFILAVCVLFFFRWCRGVISSVKRIRQPNAVLYSRTFANFDKSTTIPTSESLPTSVRVSTDVLYSATDNTHKEVVLNYSATSIRIQDFENYVKESIATDTLKSQFEMFRKGSLKPCTHGLLPENKLKNRYPNILSYDDTRVVLERISDDFDSDYINANYVEEYRKKRAYIATQGPKSQTVGDFWRMIWQEEVRVICMLANVFEGHKSKCEKYWPEYGDSRTYGDIVIVTENNQVFADYIFRTFRVSCGENTRRIEHMHYTGWADHTVPLHTHSMIEFLKKFLTMETGKGPVVVHCSAGVGRTGTFILCVNCLRRAAVTRKIDVITEFRKLRDSRLNMVDTELQYKFAHVVLAEYFASTNLPTKLPCDNVLPLAIEVLKKQLPRHIKRLDNTAWQYQALRPTPVTPQPPIPERIKKNRIPELVPVSNSLVYLKRYPTYDIYSDYINAVIVDGFQKKKQYLASQLPLPSTLSDFWRLVAEQEVQHIIVLQPPDPDDSTCCDIIADEISFNPVPFLNVEVKTNTDTREFFTIDELLLTDKSQGVVARTREISVLTCTGWSPGKNGRPPSPKNLVGFWIASENVRREEGPTLVLCHDGVTGCGLYLALSFLLERMAVERECDIILAVRAIRRSRSDFVQSQEQFEYLYDAAAKYIETFETYANFS